MPKLYDDRNDIFNAVIFSVVKNSKTVTSKVFRFFRWAPYLVAIGCFLDVFSTFFPWSQAGGQHWFLPFSVPMPLGWRVQYIGESFAILVINLAVRLGAILGLAGLVLFMYYKNRIFPSVILLISTGLSFASVIVFFQLHWSFYIGAYMVLASGFLKLASLILENLEVQIVVEDEDEASDAEC